MRKIYLHPPKGNAGTIQYLDSIDAYKTAFSANHAQVASWRKVAEPYSIHPNMARMIANGYDPGNRIREKLRLPKKQAIESCAKCGYVHSTKRCSNGDHRPRPPRISIRLDSPESAARSIERHMEPENVDQLIGLLQEGK